MMRRFPIGGMVAPVALLMAAPALAVPDVKAGVEAWAQGDYRKAVDEWRGPAVAGDADAQFNLAQAYKLGRGVPLDPALAESWFRKAAVQGHVQAADNYGLALFQAGKKAEAAPWLEKSVAHGEPRAQLVLGTMLFNGDGVPRDYPRAYALMTLASQAGVQAASQTLAQMDQYITPPDRQHGVELAQRYRAQLAALPAPAPVASGPKRVMVGPNPATGQTAASSTPAPSQSKVQPVPVAPSRPATSGYGASYPVPGAPAVREEASDLVGQRNAAAPPPAPRPRAAKPAPATHASGGAWRIQLGAFRDRGNADQLWQRVRGRLGGAKPFFVTAGGVTRLQAGGYANRSAAQAACSRSGQPCVVVAP